MATVRKRCVPSGDINGVSNSKTIDKIEDISTSKQGKEQDIIKENGFPQEETESINEKSGEVQIKDQTDQEKSNGSIQDLSKSKLHTYGLTLMILISFDLTLNYLFIQHVTNVDLKDTNNNDSHLSNTKYQMLIGSVMRSLFSVLFMFFVHLHRIYSKYPDLVYYLLLLVYYLGYSHILVCFLLDSERPDFTFDYLYCGHLIFNVIYLSCQVAVALLTWRKWKKKVSEISDAEKKKNRRVKVSDKDVADLTLIDDDLRKETNKENAKISQPIHVLAIKLMRWYKAEFFGITVGYILLSINATAQSLVPYYQAQIMDVLRAEKYATDLLVYPLAMHAFISLAEKTMAGIQHYIKGATNSRLSVHIRSALFKNLIYQDIAFFDTTRSSELTDRLSRFSDELTNVLENFESVMTFIAYILSLLVVMFLMSWRLTLVLIFCNIFLLIPGQIRVKYRQAFMTNSDKARIGASNICQEAIQCIRTVRTFANESDEAKRYSEKLQEESSYLCGEDIHWAVMSAIKKAFWIGSRALVLTYGAHLTAGGYMTGGGMVAFLIYMRNLHDMFTGLFVWRLPELIKDFSKVEKVLEYLERKPAMDLDGPLSPETFKGSIEFKDVSFNYPSRSDSRVLKNVSFKVNPGEVVALVGASGSGKSTCIQLLQRFYDPDEGQILLDGRQLSMYNHKYLHKQMALVSQEPVLFARSIYENIIYGEKGLTKEQVIQASKDANAHNFIEGLSKKYNTDAGEFGTQLSGGQKQRIAIARAIIRNPRILLLDEATSALDAKAEAEVQEALESNMAGRTVLVVAHRLSSVKHADRIVVLDEGKVVEQGPPDHVYKQKGLYYSLVKKQMIARQASEPGTETDPQPLADVEVESGDSDVHL